MELNKRLFTTAQYEAMERAGILTEDGRVELIEGEIIEKMPIGSRPAAGVGRLTHAFVQLPFYARFAIVEVWIVDLDGGKIKVFRDPAPHGYRTSRTCERPEDALQPGAFPDLVLVVADILP